MIPEEQFITLLADDDLEDCELIREAWNEANISTPLHIVHDGEELLDYLRNRGKYSSTSTNIRPSLILLDLNMPKWDGREVLQEIKSDSKLRSIPISILTTSQSEGDILEAYSLGANSFICKPPSFNDLVTAVSTIYCYWFQIARLPEHEELRV